MDQELTAEQTYRETLRGVRSFMAWNDIPECDSSSSSQDDNPFTGSKGSHTGKVSVKVPVDEWLCRKMEKLNITVQEDYPSRTSETAGLARDQFVKPPKTLKWYGMHCEKKDFSRSKVHIWTIEPARMNSTFPRIVNRSLPSAPASRPASQDTLRKWELAARDQSYMCNQAAAFSRCLTRVQDNMASQLKVIQSVTCKGKSATKVSQAADELDFLVTFNRSITQAMARTMQDLSEGVFINVANLKLARRDSYMEYIKAGIKQDTLTSLRTAPLHLSFLTTLLLKLRKKYAMKISVLLALHKENLNVSTRILSLPGNNRYRTGNKVSQLGNNLVAGDVVRDLIWARLLLSLSDRPRRRSSINDNYCVSSIAGSSVNACVTGKEACSVTSVPGSKSKCDWRRTLHRKPGLFYNLQRRQFKNFVNSSVANHVHFVSGLPQKKGVIPNYCHLYPEIKHVKGISCVNQSSSVQNVTNVPPVVPNLPVGARLHQFGGK